MAARAQSLQTDVRWRDGFATIALGRHDADILETLKLHGVDGGTAKSIMVEIGAAGARAIASSMLVHVDNVRLTIGDVEEICAEMSVGEARALDLRPVATEISAEQVLAILQVSGADLLVWHPKLGRHTRFVPLPAAFPGGIGTRFSHILVRARPDGAAWIYAVINVSLGMVDCIVPWGSTEGWALRHAFGHSLQRIGWSVVEPAFGVPDVPALTRRRRSVWLERRLRQAGLSDIRVLEGRHTVNQPRSAKGAIGRHLSALADALYDPTTRRSGHTCIVIDERVPSGIPFRRHVRTLLRASFPADADAVVAAIFTPRQPQERAA